jgi:serine/threonine protein kinase
MLAETTQLDRQSIAQYDLLEKIAEGGMGSVYKGRDRGTGQIVAIKVVPPHLMTNQVFLRRFEQEYNAARSLDHPNIVRAIDFGREAGTPWLAMEFVEGESLGARLERVLRLSEEDAIRIISQVAQGLSKAHQLGLIHRDVKPDNILITRDGIAKLTDMGLVKELDADLNLTRTGRGLGTPHFMSPEQFRNAKNADARCDIYSLAATLYMMVTGELPFKSLSPLDAWMMKVRDELPSPKALRPTLSDRIDWAIRRSMSADPAKRAASCEEFLEDLKGLSGIHSPTQTPLPDMDAWYLLYTDEDGVVHTIKGSSVGIRRSLREGLLGDAANVRIGRNKTGPFEPLRQHPEFRDYLKDVSPTPLPRTALPQPIAATERQDHGTPPPTRIEPRPLTTPPRTRSTPPVQRPASRQGSQAEAPAPLTTPPRIALEADPGGDWSKWLVFLAIAASAGVGAFYFAHRLPSLRMLF